jgi:hypothetical protein
MHVACLCAQVYFVEERAVIRVCRETLVLLLEHDGDGREGGSALLDP